MASPYTEPIFWNPSLIEFEKLLEKQNKQAS